MYRNILISFMLLTCSLVIWAHAHVHETPKHTKQGEHNPDYDHEAFLGKDESQEFDNLSPEESKKRLGLLFDKVDTNSDGLVTSVELAEWIRSMSKRYMNKDVERSWSEYQLPNDQKLNLDTYLKAFTKEESEVDDDSEHLKKVVEREKLRWKAADLNGDNELSKEEYMAFLHPEEFEHMRPIVVDEVMADIDLDHDGFVDETEYMSDMGVDPKSPPSQDSEWIQQEKERFHNERDKNKDGKLDKEEMIAWIAPSSEEFTMNEAKHLITESDDNKDGSLSKEEMLIHHDIFAGSQATDYGQALHDEL